MGSFFPRKNLFFSGALGLGLELALGEIIDSKLTRHLRYFAMKKNKFTTHFYGERRGYGVCGQNIILYIWPL